MTAAAARTQSRARPEDDGGTSAIAAPAAWSQRSAVGSSPGSQASEATAASQDAVHSVRPSGSPFGLHGPDGTSRIGTHTRVRSLSPRETASRTRLPSRTTVVSTLPRPGISWSDALGGVARS